MGERHEGPGCAHLLERPWHAEYPLAGPPYVDKAEMLARAREMGVEPPAMYALGYKHANCGGGCVRAGASQFVQLLTLNPTRYAWWEEQEELTRVHLGKDVAILRDRRGGETKPMTLRALRERHEAEPEQTEMFDGSPEGGEACDCFTINNEDEVA
jgi:hypothetical protein